MGPDKSRVSWGVRETVEPASDLRGVVLTVEQKLEQLGDSRLRKICYGHR